ncbi:MULTISPECIES: HigA family addiction module antitoxin [Massilia]|uniref:HigA family addiction module antitoxin n=1 Tax=Massilia TaxID=149698 RepID=UPI001615FDD0|nr:MULTISPECIES: HigA family addiction module antitoxin [Massilia]MDY0963202.1 HigA family addiction module antitoxin [Massilia sp. CFBP9026]
MFINGMRPIHPGEILREEYLEPLGMSANALAGALRLTAARVNEIVREKRGITPDTALRLSRYFGTTPEFWLNLQMTYELRKTIETEGKLIMETIQPLEMEPA